ncbi:hypothetical protein [Streptomyces sp. RKCA744]|nr:hypothetical protein [Streptomyces sp. RKCA744]MCO8305671.1 hypothetical protein [Streptomyces sp. RKCA744]
MENDKSARPGAAAAPGRGPEELERTYVETFDLRRRSISPARPSRR